MLITSAPARISYRGSAVKTANKSGSAVTTADKTRQCCYNRSQTALSFAAF